MQASVSAQIWYDQLSVTVSSNTTIIPSKCQFKFISRVVIFITWGLIPSSIVTEVVWVLAIVGVATSSVTQAQTNFTIAVFSSTAKASHGSVIVIT